MYASDEYTWGRTVKAVCIHNAALDMGEWSILPPVLNARLYGPWSWSGFGLFIYHLTMLLLKIPVPPWNWISLIQKITAIWGVMTCSLVEIINVLEEHTPSIRCFFSPPVSYAEDGGSAFLQKMGRFISIYIASH